MAITRRMEEERGRQDEGANKEIITMCIQRCAGEHVGVESAVSVVDLPATR